MKKTIDKEIKKKFLKEIKKLFDENIGVGKDEYEDNISSGGRFKKDTFGIYELYFIELLLESLDINAYEYYSEVYDMRKSFEELKKDLKEEHDNMSEEERKIHYG